MISVYELEAILITGGLLALACCAMCYAHGRGDRRRLRALRATWRAEVREELRPIHEAAVELAEQRGADRVREELRAEHQAGVAEAEQLGVARAREVCGCASADRQIREARTETADLRGQFDILSRRLRRAQDLAGYGGLVRADQLMRVLDGQPLGDRTDSTAEAAA